MSKPDWKDSPEWAGWLAQDQDGLWWWYKFRPIDYGDSWDERPDDESSDSMFACYGDPNSDWHKTLEERPRWIGDAEEEECIKLAESRMNDESVKTSIDELRSDTQKYSAYYKDVRHIEYIDVYRVLGLFECDRHGHAIGHAAKKLLLSGRRTGQKSVEHDVREAIDALTRWLEMRKEDEEIENG